MTTDDLKALFCHSVLDLTLKVSGLSWKDGCHFSKRHSLILCLYDDDDGGGDMHCPSFSPYNHSVTFLIGGIVWRRPLPAWNVLHHVFFVTTSVVLSVWIHLRYGAGTLLQHPCLCNCWQPLSADSLITSFIDIFTRSKKTCSPLKLDQCGHQMQAVDCNVLNLFTDVFPIHLDADVTSHNVPMETPSSQAAIVTETSLRTSGFEFISILILY